MSLFVLGSVVHCDWLKHSQPPTYNQSQDSSHTFLSHLCVYLSKTESVSHSDLTLPYLTCVTYLLCYYVFREISWSITITGRRLPLLPIIALTGATDGTTTFYDDSRQEHQDHPLVSSVSTTTGLLFNDHNLLLIHGISWLSY